MSAECRRSAEPARRRPLERHGLDMTHETGRRGSPQTLVCTKTRRTYERQRTEHKIDVTAMSMLLRVIDGARGELATLVARMAEATGSELEFACPQLHP